MAKIHERASKTQEMKRLSGGTSAAVSGPNRVDLDPAATQQRASVAQLSKMEESKYPSVHTLHKRHQSAGKRKVQPVRDQFNATGDLNSNSKLFANRRVQSGVKSKGIMELQQSL